MADNAYEELFNCDVVDVNGDKVGSVGQVYLDDQTGQPSWVTVKTGLFGLKETFVPLEQAVVADGKITTPYAADKVKEAPRVDPDKHLDADEEAELYGYYGIATVVAVEPEAVAQTEDEAAEPAVDEAVTSDVTVVEDEGAAEPLVSSASAAAVEEDAPVEEAADEPVDPETAEAADDVVADATEMADALDDAAAEVEGEPDEVERKSE